MAKLKDGFYKQTAESVGSDLYVLLAGGGSKPLSDFATASASGNYVTLETSQTITGAKTFANNIYINSSLSISDEVGNGVLGVKSTTWTGVPSDGTAISLGTLNNSLYFRSSGDNMYHYRTDKGDAYKVLDASNYNYYSPTLTGGGASGTWGINITGSASSADIWDGKHFVKSYKEASDIDWSSLMWTANSGCDDVTSMGYSAVMNIGTDLYRGWQIWNNRNNHQIFWRPAKTDASDWADVHTLIDDKNISNYLPVVTNYYWANVKISSSSSTTTTPTFGKTTATTYSATQNGQVLYWGPAQEYWLGSNNTGDYYLWSNNSTARLRLGTNGSERMTILTNGNVGIGTNSPSYKLDVANSARVASIVMEYNDEINRYDGSLFLQHRGTIAGSQGNSRTGNIYMCANGGVVGIGTTSASEKLSVNGSIYTMQPSTNRRAGIIGTYDPNRAAAIWSMGASYQIAADGTSLGNLYGAAYVYYGSGYTFGAGKSGGHSFVWCQNGTPYVALGNNIWTSGNIQLSNSSGGDSPRLIFERGSSSDSTYDWDIYVKNGGSLKIRRNESGSWTEIMSLYNDNNTIVANWPIVGNLSGTASNADTVDSWHASYFANNYEGSRHYRIKFGLGSEDKNWKMIAKTTSNLTTAPTSSTWLASLVKGRIFRGNGNYSQGQIVEYPFVVVFHYVSGTSLIDTATLYLPQFAKDYDVIRVVKVSTNKYELQVRMQSSWQNDWIEFQGSGSSLTCYESLQTANTTGTVVCTAATASTLTQDKASYAYTAGSAPASDVYAWAKAATKPSYSFSEITPGVATIGDGANRLMFRTNTAWISGMYYSTPGGESMVFANVNPVTSWIFATANATNRPDWTGLTPSLQIKNQKVAINKLIANGAEGAYNLDVNGSANATTLYENGVRVSVSGHTHTYLPLAGGTMTGCITTKTGNNTGIKVGDTYITSVSGELLLQNNSAIRFGGASWDWNVWAGLKYVPSSKTIYLGLADGTQFTANSAQSGGTFNLPGISTMSMVSGARIHASNGNLYLGNYDNSGWLMLQDVCSQSGNTYWNIYHSGSARFGQITSTVATGTAPFVISSTTVNTNLNADLLDGLHLNSTTRNNEANKVMRTDGNGYANFGWINTTSGAASGTITRIYCSQDSYVRYLTPNDTFVTMVGTLSEGTSDLTDNTEILTSYASNNGFADTNAPNVVYKRDAVKVYNYIKGKLDSVYQAKGSYLTSRGYIGTTAVQASSAAQSLTGIGSISTAANNTYDLGTTGTRWKTIYAYTMYAATAFYQSSDISLKTNIQNLSKDLLDRVYNINEVSFNWKESGREAFGYIAQDYEAISKTFVDRQDDGTLTLDYTKALVAQIAALKQKIVNLEERLHILERS